MINSVRRQDLPHVLVFALGFTRFDSLTKTCVSSLSSRQLFAVGPDFAIKAEQEELSSRGHINTLYL